MEGARVPLRAARDWRDARFLAIGVDVTAENASNTPSTDCFACFRAERSIGTRLVGGGRVFYRTRSGIEAASRDEFAERVKQGEVARETPVFDTSITGAADWRTKFEQPAGKGWTARFFAMS